MKISWTRLISRVKFTTLGCKLVFVLMKMTHQKTKCLDCESAFCVIFYGASYKFCFFVGCLISFWLQCCLHPSGVPMRC